MPPFSGTLLLARSKQLLNGAELEVRVSLGAGVPLRRWKSDRQIGP